MRLTKEREAEIRADNGCEGYACDRANVIADLLAELDAVRAERDEALDAIDVIAGACREQRERAEARGRDERAKVLAWLRGKARLYRRMFFGAREAFAREIADAIERGEHEVKP